MGEIIYENYIEIDIDDSLEFPFLKVKVVLSAESNESVPRLNESIIIFEDDGEIAAKGIIKKVTKDKSYTTIYAECPVERKIGEVAPISEMIIGEDGSVTCISSKDLNETVEIFDLTIEEIK